MSFEGHAHRSGAPAAVLRRLVRGTKLGGVAARLSKQLLGATLMPGRAASLQSLADAYAQGWTQCRCVFVLSTGRVGTRTLAAILEQSPVVRAQHEPVPRLIKASFNAYMEGGDLSDLPRWGALVLAARDDHVFAANRDGKIYVETNNRLTQLAGAIGHAFPASRFIHLHRRPYEVIRSTMRRRYYQGHDWDFARIRPRATDPVAKEWGGWSSLAKNAWHWATVNGDAERFLRQLAPSRGLSLRADQLFRGDPDTLQSLFAFMGIPTPPVSTIRKVLDAKMNAQPGGWYPPPSEWSTGDRAIVNDIVGDVARRLGYDLADAELSQ